MPHKILLNQYVHKRLKIVFIFYLIIAFVMLWLLVYKTILYSINYRYVVVSFLFGMILGILLCRMVKICWDDQLEKVISRIDAFGFFVLIIFIAFDIFHPKIVGLFVLDEVVPITSLAAATGVVYGRVLGLRDSIYRILKKNNII